METMTVKEFKDKNNIELIQEIMLVNNGYITSKIVTELGIHRMYLNIMEKRGMIKKVGNGVYIDANKIEDSYYVFSISTPQAVFSHMTALYFYGLASKAPTQKYEITIKRDYHNPRVNEHETFYVSDDLYELGINEVETPRGNKVKAYDIERCICDIIRSRKRMDIEHIKYSVKEYLKTKEKNLSKLSMYAEKMNTKDEVMEFVSMMYE